MIGLIILNSTIIPDSSTCPNLYSKNKGDGGTQRVTESEREREPEKARELESSTENTSGDAINNT